uniref:Epidermal patterning factor-like protein n=1 Tax=Opuntia streptacantha TaxID=393608 RepID=A0A7C9DXE7_OPUST
MKFSLRPQKYCILVFVLLAFLAIGIATHHKPKHSSLRNKSFINENPSHSYRKGPKGEELGRELYPVGSRLPDCSHACGECSPCKRVMVSFKCSSESCPIVYRCMCNGKYYHVPSSN